MAANHFFFDKTIFLVVIILHANTALTNAISQILKNGIKENSDKIKTLAEATVNNTRNYAFLSLNQFHAIDLHFTSTVPFARI